ncbi:hypothetical protein [Mesorhizobium amorphae]|uniref:hypothetical protein n=1 Tax=Mesorhizobium amorphae TaxID=71433 RepID=UPI0017820E85|nr:hypothetical protein [Mesorhizobium amorphae]
MLVLVDVLPFVLLSRSRSLSLLQDPPEQLFDVDFDELDDFEVDTDFVPTRMISPSCEEICRRLRQNRRCLRRQCHERRCSKRCRCELPETCHPACSFQSPGTSRGGW